MITKSTAFVALFLLGACSRPAGEGVATKPAIKDSVAVAPAIVAPEEVADPAAPPSYEVAIASAAAARNKAKERCEKQPESVRAQCEQEANAAFAEVEAGLQDLRGNQP